jgi:hypothetical protein
MLFLCFNVSAESSPMCSGKVKIHDEQNELVDFDPSIHELNKSALVTYTNSDFIPYFEYAALRTTRFVFYNQSNRDVRFFYRPNFFLETEKGRIQNRTLFENFQQEFSISNCPLDAEGALLPAKSLGIIFLPENKDGNTYIANAEIFWESEECGVPPILATVEHVMMQPSGNRNIRKVGFSQHNINDGKAF